MTYTVEVEIEGTATRTFAPDNVRILGRFENKEAAVALILCVAPEPQWMPLADQRGFFSIRWDTSSSRNDPRWIGIRASE